MMGRRAWALMSLLLLAACGDYTIDKRESEAGHITDISFQAAHSESCAAGKCGTRHFPDRWFIRVCEDRQNSPSCRVRAIEHAPWKWMYEGAPVTMQWSHSPAGGWRLDEFTAR